MGNSTQQDSSEVLWEMSNACAYVHTTLVGHLRKAGQNCCLALCRTASFAGTLGQCPQDWGVPTNLQQLQELAAEALTCSK